MWDEDATHVHEGSQPRSERNRDNKFYGDLACPLPGANGHPKLAKHEHMVRIAPCGAELWPFCARLKITRLKPRKTQTASTPLVVGWGEITASNAKGKPGHNALSGKCFCKFCGSNKDGPLDKDQVECTKAKVHRDIITNADAMIRAAVAEMRFMAVTGEWDRKMARTSGRAGWKQLRATRELTAANVKRCADAQRKHVCAHNERCKPGERLCSRRGSMLAASYLPSCAWTNWCMSDSEFCELNGTCKHEGYTSWKKYNCALQKKFEVKHPTASVKDWGCNPFIAPKKQHTCDQKKRSTGGQKKRRASGKAANKSASKRSRNKARRNNRRGHRKKTGRGRRKKTRRRRRRRD